MAKTVILEEQTFSGFVDIGGIYGGAITVFPITDGETYFVRWDGEEYECVAKTVVFSGVETIGVGNLALAGFEDNTGEPFLIGALSDGSDAAAYTTSTDASHTIAIYQVASESNGNVLGTLFQDIADAIREKTGNTATMKPAEFPDKIAAIETGGGGGGGALSPGLYFKANTLGVTSYRRFFDFKGKHYMIANDGSLKDESFSIYEWDGNAFVKLFSQATSHNANGEVYVCADAVHFMSVYWHVIWDGVSTSCTAISQNDTAYTSHHIERDGVFYKVENGQQVSVGDSYVVYGYRWDYALNNWSATREAVYTYGQTIFNYMYAFWTNKFSYKGEEYYIHGKKLYCPVNGGQSFNVVEFDKYINQTFFVADHYLYTAYLNVLSRIDLDAETKEREEIGLATYAYTNIGSYFHFLDNGELRYSAVVGTDGKSYNWDYTVYIIENGTQ